jgi:hypothetical protein
METELVVGLARNHAQIPLLNLNLKSDRGAGKFQAIMRVTHYLHCGLCLKELPEMRSYTLAIEITHLGVFYELLP